MTGLYATMGNRIAQGGFAHLHLGFVADVKWALDELERLEFAIAAMHRPPA